MTETTITVPVFFGWEEYHKASRSLVQRTRNPYATLKGAVVIDEGNRQGCVDCDGRTRNFKVEGRSATRVLGPTIGSTLHINGPRPKRALIDITRLTVVQWLDGQDLALGAS